MKVIPYNYENWWRGYMQAACSFKMGDDWYTHFSDDMYQIVTWRWLKS